MSDERDKQGQPQGFKVSDRRKRYEEPAADAPAPEAAPAPAPEASAAPAAAAPGPASEAVAGGDAGQPAAPDAEAHPDDLDGAAGAGLPGPADFLQLIGKLYQEGLAFMGMFDDPRSGQPSMANFPIASWHIDILGVLEQKTKGNLSAEEAKLLTEAIANLKVTFVRASGYIKH
jgi:hypothetical protein